MSWVDSILGSFKKLGMVHALSKYRVFDGLRRSILMAWVITKDGVKKGKLKCKICNTILEGAEGIEDAEYHIFEWHPEVAWEGENPRDYIEFIEEDDSDDS